MTDFAIVGWPGLGIGRFIVQHRLTDLQSWAQSAGKKLYGMFAEVYDPYRVPDYTYGGIKTMDPYVRREVLSHLGFQRLDLEYIHPSWTGDGEAIGGLDLCFLPMEEEVDRLPSTLVVSFLRRYYTILENKPQQWYDMIDSLAARGEVPLLPL